MNKQQITRKYVLYVCVSKIDILLLYHQICAGVVHMVGGVSGLVATLMLGPRIGRFEENAPRPSMCNPANAIVGMFMLW